MTRVFLSHALEDRKFVSELSRALKARGAETFVDYEHVRPGEDVSTTILAQLQRSDLVVFVVPRFEGQGKNALFELGAAKALGKRIVAVLPEGVRRSNSDIASALSRTLLLDASAKNVGLLADQVLSDLAAA